MPGKYWATITDEHNCSITDTSIVTKESCINAIYFPSAFMPGGVGQNNIYRAKAFGEVDYFKMQIFNRWGQKVFETNDWKKGWDGYFKGNAQPIGVYVWMASYKLHNATPIANKGTITLVR